MCRMQQVWPSKCSSPANPTAWTPFYAGASCWPSCWPSCCSDASSARRLSSLPLVMAPALQGHEGQGHDRLSILEPIPKDRARDLQPFTAHWLTALATHQHPVLRPPQLGLPGLT